MTAESNVGARIFLIGKDGVLTGLREIQAATAKLNAEIAAGAKSSAVASAGYAEQSAGLEALGVKMDLYQKNLGVVSAETAALARVGKVAFFTMAAATAAWSYESIKWAQSYQTALVQLRTQAGLTVTAMNAIGAAARSNAAGLGISPTAYLQAAYHPASTGMSVAQTIAITNYAAKEAAISGAPLEDTTNSLTGVMKAMGFGAGQTASTIAKLNAIVGAGNMRFSDLNAALGSGVAATAKTFGVSLTSLGGALAYQTDRGVPAAQAGTRLRMAMSLLGAPSAEATKFLTDAGLSQTQAKDRTNAMAQTLIAAGLTTTQLSSALRNNSGAGGIYNALELLHKSLAGSGMSAEMQAAFISRSFGGGRMGTTIESLYNNLPGLAAKSGQINKNATNAKFNQDWIATTKTLDFQLHKLEGTVETLGTTFGLAIIPPLTKVIGLFSELLGFIGRNKGLAIGLATAITGILAPAIGLYLYRALLSSGGAIRSVIGAYARLMGMQTEEQVAMTRTDAMLATNDAAYVSNDAALSTNDAALLANAGDRTASGGGLGLGGIGMGGGLGGGGLMSIGGKLATGGLAASLLTPLFNQFARPGLTKAVGARGATDISDALSGAELGMRFGPAGILIGAAGGALWGERGHLKQDLISLGKAEHRGAHNFVHGADVLRHDLASGWDSIFGGGHLTEAQQKAGMGGAIGGGALFRGPATIHVHVHLDGKEITKSVTKQITKTASMS